MIVKTPAEAHRIPTIEDNVHALEEAALAAAAHRGERPSRARSTASWPRRGRWWKRSWRSTPTRAAR